MSTLRPPAFPPDRVFSLFACAAVLTTAACGSGPQPGGDTAAVTTDVEVTGGTVHVRNRGEPPVWAAEPVAVIGSTAGGGSAGPDEFGRIHGVLGDDDGHVYVADAQAREIRVFDGTGRFVRTIGRRGDGPGEIGALYSIAWAGDTLAVLDPGTARIGLFHRDGDWAGHYRHLPMTGDIRWVRLHPSLDAGFATPTIHMSPDRRDPVFARFTRHGPLDTLPRPMPPDDLPHAHIVCPHSTGGGITFFAHPFAAAFLVTFGPDGDPVIVRRSDQYRIAFLDSDGDTLRVIERETRTVPIAGAEWDDALAATGYDEFRRRDPGARCEPSGFTRPAAKPAIRHLFFDDVGRMWVEAITHAGFAFDVFDPDGRLVATVPVSERLERVSPYVRGDRLYLVQAGELDVEAVAVFRIRPPTGR